MYDDDEEDNNENVMNSPSRRETRSSKVCPWLCMCSECVWHSRVYDTLVHVLTAVIAAKEKNDVEDERRQVCVAFWRQEHIHSR